MDLKEIRKRLDLIDSRIFKLLSERFELALRADKTRDKGTDAGMFGEDMEGLLDYARSYPQSLLRPEFCEHLFDEIKMEGRQIREKPLKLIGFQGEHGAYGDVAARTYNSGFVSMPCLEFADVFQSVEQGLLDFGIVPVENSVEGVITQVNDILVETDLNIVGEINIQVHHSLIALPETGDRQIRIVYSHPQALAQCRDYLVRNRLEPRPYYDTAGAAKMLSEQRPEAAAVIANKLCARIYRLKEVENNIEDNEANSTRFVIVSREPGKEAGNKCSIVFVAEHRPGSLFNVLKIFATEGIDLTRIASRPLRRDISNYSFFLDFKGSDHDEKVIRTLRRVKETTVMYNFLGCYQEWMSEDRLP